MPEEHNGRGKIGLLDGFAVFLIRVYQKFISPFKGFSCAHRYQHGGPSCSEYVRQVILKQGFSSGMPKIRSRFKSCRQSALSLQSVSAHPEAGFLDCSPDGCAPDGCGDFFNADGGADGSGKSSTIIIIPSGILILLLLYGGYIWYQNQLPQVTAIEIRLVEDQQEAEEKGVARLIGGKNLDYHVVFSVDGRNIKTNTRDNSSAEDWLSLEPKEGFVIGDLEKITILDKQVLKDNILDVIDSPQSSGSGRIYEYRLTEQ